MIILGGIYSGFFTPTEAAVVSVVYSFIIGTFVYKELNFKGAYKAFKDAVVVNGSTTFMVGFSTVFAAFLTIAQIPNMIAEGITGLTSNKFLILLIINLLLLVIGMFVDNIPATIILTPILLPICTSFGMSPVTFGIMLTMNLAIGFCSPPYGINLFVASSISKVSIEDLTKNIIKPLIGLLIVLLLITYIPYFTTLFI